MDTEAPLVAPPDSAQDADPELAGAAAGGVILRLGASRYAVEMADVAEVTAVPQVTRVPDAPAWLSGVANWRGRMLPVVDLRPLLGAGRVPLASSARLVVLARDAVVAGVLAEAVPGVYDGGLSAPDPAPPTVGADAASLVAGQVTDRHGPLAVLDAEAVLALRNRLDRRRHG